MPPVASVFTGVRSNEAEAEAEAAAEAAAREEARVEADVEAEEVEVVEVVEVVDAEVVEVEVVEVEVGVGHLWKQLAVGWQNTTGGCSNAISNSLSLLSTQPNQLRCSCAEDAHISTYMRG
jgi:hypothetical protein